MCVCVCVCVCVCPFHKKLLGKIVLIKSSFNTIFEIKFYLT